MKVHNDSDIGKGPGEINKLGTLVLREAQDKLIYYFITVFCSSISIHNLKIDA